jgi:hypothetical protein
MAELCPQLADAILLDYNHFTFYVSSPPALIFQLAFFHEVLPAISCTICLLGAQTLTDIVGFLAQSLLRTFSRVLSCFVEGNIEFNWTNFVEYTSSVTKKSHKKETGKLV